MTNTHEFNKLGNVNKYLSVVCKLCHLYCSQTLYKRFSQIQAVILCSLVDICELQFGIATLWMLILTAKVIDKVFNTQVSNFFEFFFQHFST